MDYEAAIFDLDGTLIDSMGMWGEIDIEYLERFGIEVPENLQRDLEGLRFTEVAEYFRERSGKIRNFRLHRGNRSDMDRHGRI